MNCPDCGGPMWDNRQTKKKPTQPDYKCKDKDGCGKGVWIEKKDAAPASNGNGAARPTGALAPVYGECMEIASRAVRHYIGDKATAADIIAATATLFIGATNTGRPVKPVKAAAVKPAPPPPPPKPPEPEPEPEYIEEDLPF